MIDTRKTEKLPPRKSKLCNLFFENAIDYINTIYKQNKFIKEMRKAISENQLSIYLQPKINTSNWEIESAESLIRWSHPTKGWIMPKDFINCAEKSNIIHEIDSFMLESVVKLLSSWEESNFPLVKISVNISADSLIKSDICALLTNLLQLHKVEPSFIEIEVTERTMITNEDTVIQVLNELQKLGVTIALDDFGKGYSSVLYLEKYQFDTIKLDKSFIMGLPYEQKSNLITKSIIRLAHSLNLKVVAEGVENINQLDVLEKMKCDVVQGYFFSKPISVKEFEGKYLRI